MPKSHSTRVRGLKFFLGCYPKRSELVALYTSAWIEISYLISLITADCVALYTSAWIEIRVDLYTFTHITVALYTSAWIEMPS